MPRARRSLTGGLAKYLGPLSEPKEGLNDRPLARARDAVGELL